jgi:hypothetical protein
MPGQQAKSMRPMQERTLLSSLATPRSPACDRVRFLVSLKAGLRAKAVASLTCGLGAATAGEPLPDMGVDEPCQPGVLLGQWLDACLRMAQGSGHGVHNGLHSVLARLSGVSHTQV